MPCCMSAIALICLEEQITDAANAVDGETTIVVHAEEKAEIDRKRHADGLADGFLAEAYKRDEQHRRRENAKRRQT